MMKMCDVLCPDKNHLMATVSLSRNTVTDWEDVGKDAEGELYWGVDSISLHHISGNIV